MRSAYNLIECDDSIISLSAWAKRLIRCQPLSALMLEELLKQSYVRMPHAKQWVQWSEFMLPILSFVASPFTLSFSIAAAMLAYPLPRLCLLVLMAWRRFRLQQALLDVLTLLLICVEMSDNFLDVFEQMSQGLVKNRYALAFEIKGLCQGLQHRSQQQWVWQQFSTKFQSKEFSLLSDLLYLNQLYGHDSTTNLALQIDEIHAQRLSSIKRKVERVKLRLRLLVIVCFMPALMIVIFGPLVLRLNEGMKLMQPVSEINIVKEIERSQ